MSMPQLLPVREESRQESTEFTERLEARIAELERERDQLVTVIDILQGISSSLHFEEILQTIARKLGETFGLDRSSIYLAADAREARLVATYEDPGVRNLIVDLERYPELKQALESGKAVFIPDAATDPMLRSARAALEGRNVRSIIVAPIMWQGTTIGAIFLRSGERATAPFSDHDVRFCQVIASLTASALRNAHRFEALKRVHADTQGAQRGAERERLLLLAFMRRLLDGYLKGPEHRVAETLLPEAAHDELDRMTSLAWAAIGREGTA